MEEKLYVMAGGRKKLARKVICKICEKEILVRNTVPHSGYCRNCWCKVCKAGTVDTSNLGGRKVRPKFERECPNCKEKKVVYKPTINPRLCKKCNVKSIHWKKCGRPHPKLGKGNPNIKEIENKRKRDKRKEQRIRLIKYFGNECKKCGEKNLPIHVFQFHHILPKQYEMATLMRHNNWKMIEEEAKRCIMLCANCHQIEHHGDERIE